MDGQFSLGLPPPCRYLLKHVSVINMLNTEQQYVHSETRVARGLHVEHLHGGTRRKHPADAGGSEGSARLNCTEATCVLVQAGGATLRGGQPSATLHLQSQRATLGLVKEASTLSEDAI